MLLLCIDVCSRKLYAEPLENKMPQVTLASLRRIVQRAGAIDKEVDSDIGNKISGHFGQWLDINEISHRERDPRQSNALAAVDNAIRSLKQIMAQAMTARKTGSWEQVLLSSDFQYFLYHFVLQQPTPKYSERQEFLLSFRILSETLHLSSINGT